MASFRLGGAEVVAAGEHAAGGHYVLAARGAYGGGDSFGVEGVAEALHLFGGGGEQVGAGDRVEADEVHAAVEAVEASGKLVAVARGVVDAAEHDILEREAPLVGEIVAAQQLHDLLDWVGLLDGHQRGALRGVWRVDGDGDVDLGFVEEALQGLELAYGAYGDAFGAPCQSPFGSKYLDCLEHGAEVVGGFAHSHEDQVGERLARGNREHLVQNLMGCEIAVEALAAGHAKGAVHLASGL